MKYTSMILGDLLTQRVENQNLV